MKVMHRKINPREWIECGLQLLLKLILKDAAFVKSVVN